MSEEKATTPDTSTEETVNDAPTQTTSDKKVEKPAEAPKDTAKAESDEKSKDKPEVKQKLSVAKDEVELLKSKLAAANKKKEAAFQKKQEIGGAIAERIKQVGEFKRGRDDLTKKVRELKKKRDELNGTINSRIAEIKKLTDGKPIPRMPRAPPRGRGRRDRKEDESPQGLKRKIEQLEYKLETQPMGFASEQKINKQIRDLKKKYGEKMKAFAGMEEVLEKSKEIDRLKKEANELHAQVTKLAQDSQKRHESLIEQSKEIDELKKQEEELYQNFLNEKQKFAELNAKLKGKQGVLKETKMTVHQERAKVRKQKEEEDKKTLKERAKEAEEKVKKKQKLTTEDILAMQGMK